MMLSLFEFLGILFAGISIITYFIGRSQGRKENEELHAKMDKIKDELRDEISDDTIDALNAQDRVREGGKVVKRNKKPVADIIRKISEMVSTGENIQAVKSNKREIIERVEVGDGVGIEVGRAKKPYDIKTQNIKQFTADVILVKSDEEKEESKFQTDSSQDKTPQDSEP